ncbi:hypothetical protein AYO41_01530 [Verrucomicrobia bacterium SCGC AG-212-E04]|nr:hypothetical protein AYO41_01530 [Verrucomicrobia bacterium SCGC AG-212-E04]
MSITQALFSPITSYARWLHTRWPAGTVERLPEVGVDGATVVQGVRIVGDLSGIPLLKFSADTGARAVQAILKEPDFAGQRGDKEVLDIVIIGGGVSGLSAALEAKKAGLSFKIYEAAEAFSTIVNFPKAKHIYTYPTEMVQAGEVKFAATVKEALLAELEAQRAAAGIEFTKDRIDRVERTGGNISVHHADKRVTKARRCVIAIGRSGNYRKLGVPGEQLDKVSNRLYDPKEFTGKRVLVVGGGDSALETAIACTICGADVTLSYRAKEFGRAKPENVDKVRELEADPAAAVAVENPKSERVNAAASHAMRESTPHGKLRVLLGSEVKEIALDAVKIKTAAGEESIPNDNVFSMIGREAPLDFFRRSGIPIRGEWRAWTWISFILFFAFSVFLYQWKKQGVVIADVWGLRQIASIGDIWSEHGWFPYGVPDWWASLGGAFNRKTNLLGVMKVSLGEPGFYYSLAYCLCVALFGWKRYQRRRTPYVKLQTITLACVQIIPLFLMPYILLPWAGLNGWFDHGAMKWLADQLFPAVTYTELGREYWRAFGLVLAWPLFFWNAFTDQPMWLWLIISVIQTFVIIPFIVMRWGKGAYCGWLCSCGALAETLGDTQRSKMPHGPFWNRMNMIGQVFLAFAILLMIFRSIGWATGPQSFASRSFSYLFHDLPLFNYVWFVDLFWAGIMGVGMYFWFSGRVWCRFACPLAALMHIYARFGKFRIFPDKKKCISCNVCTSVCHQGIDIMSFANKGLPMEDPECVRCSACVQQCPTGVLSFGRYDPSGTPLLDKLMASPVQMREHAAKH